MSLNTCTNWTRGFALLGAPQVSALSLSGTAKKNELKFHCAVFEGNEMLSWTRLAQDECTRHEVLLSLLQLVACSAQHLQLFFPIRPFSLLLSPSLRRRRPQIQKQKGVLETELESNPLRPLALAKESCMASVPVLLSAVDKTCHQDPFSRTVHELSYCFKLLHWHTFGEKYY